MVDSMSSTGYEQNWTLERKLLRYFRVGPNSNNLWNSFILQIFGLAVMEADFFEVVIIEIILTKSMSGSSKIASKIESHVK